MGDLTNLYLFFVGIDMSKKSQTCHGPKMEGDVGPKLTGVGQKLLMDEFKSVIKTYYYSKD